jgi:uncharacterized protein (TIGR03435 family)
MAKPLLLSVVSIAIAAPAFGQQTASSATPQWQIKAGGKLAFDVASIRQGDPGAFTPPNFPLDAGDAFTRMRTNDPPRGRFVADFPLSIYITFAYKLSLTQEQMRAMLANLPKWVATDRLYIQARAEGNPTKDQMRLMMQSLLAERFKLAVHFEIRETAVLALTLAKPGKTGPKLRPHAEGPPCDVPPVQQTAGTSDKGAEIFPPVCDVYGMTVNSGRKHLGGSRNTTMERLAAALPSFGGVDRPVVDETGLNGTFDFTLEWMPEPNGPALPDPNVQPDSQGPTFLEALREQLGLRLESKRAPIQTLVIDHVERPSEN